MPPANTAAATVYCTTTCTRPIDPANPPGGPANFRFAQGIMVDTNGSVYLTEDAFAGARGGRGHAWVSPFMPYPSGVIPVLPLPGPVTPPAGNQVCAATVNVPALASGTTYWLQFTAHTLGVLSATWKLTIAQSAQLNLYPGNPYFGKPDPTTLGPTGGIIAGQNTSNTATFNITTAPTAKAAGTYTVQFFNAASSIAATTGTISYTNDGATACPTSPLVGNIIP
jgi:hypothetical protein